MHKATAMGRSSFVEGLLQSIQHEAGVRETRQPTMRRA